MGENLSSGLLLLLFYFIFKILEKELSVGSCMLEREVNSVRRLKRKKK